MKRRDIPRVAPRAQPKRDELEKRLLALLDGEAVKLRVTYERQSGKKRREVNLLVLIAPGEIYGLRSGLYLVSVLGKGCSIVDVKSSKNVSGLIIAGIPAKLAHEVDRALKQIQEK